MSAPSSDALFRDVKIRASDLGEYLTSILGTPDVTDGLLLAGTGIFVMATGTFSVAAGVSKVVYTAGGIAVSKTTEKLLPPVHDFASEFVYHFKARLVELAKTRELRRSLRMPVVSDRDFNLQEIYQNPLTNTWSLVDDIGIETEVQTPMSTERQLLSSNIPLARKASQGLLIGESDSDSENEFDCLTLTTENKAVKSR